MSLVLEHSCPWPREGLSSERLSLASDFFVSLVLALASSLVSSTPPLLNATHAENISDWRDTFLQKKARSKACGTLDK